MNFLVEISYTMSVVVEAENEAEAREEANIIEWNWEKASCEVIVSPADEEGHLL